MEFHVEVGNDWSGEYTHRRITYIVLQRLLCGGDWFARHRQSKCRWKDTKNMNRKYVSILLGLRCWTSTWRRRSSGVLVSTVRVKVLLEA